MRGFVNKGQVAKLRRISAKTQNLLTALEQADDAGLTLIVEHALKEDLSDDAQYSLDDLRGALEALIKNLTTQPRDEPFLEDTSREHLVEWFASWWRSSTGQKPKIQERIEGSPPPTPFMYVANEVFNLPSMPHPTGASYKSLKDHFRNIRNRKKKRARLGEIISNLSGPPSDDT